MRTYGVALWVRWCPATWGFADRIGVVVASSAFAAVAVLMKRHGWSRIAYASVYAVDRSIVYRCHRVQLAYDEQAEGEVFYAISHQ